MELIAMPLRAKKQLAANVPFKEDRATQNVIASALSFLSHYQKTGKLISIRSCFLLVRQMGLVNIFFCNSL
jgi:hypothetical protein